MFLSRFNYYNNNLTLYNRKISTKIFKINNFTKKHHLVIYIGIIVFEYSPDLLILRKQALKLYSMKS